MKPMLAAASSGENISYPAIVSPKLDGIRAIIIDGVVMSRSMKPIPNRHVQKLLGIAKLNGFDGELIVGHPTAKDVYNKTSSAVMSRDGEPDVQFYVFDWFSEFYAGMEYSKRLDKIGQKIDTMPAWIKNYIVIHQHEWAHDKSMLDQAEYDFLAQGYEGIMIRHPEGPYKQGRSTLKEGYLLKIKRFTDSEAVITAVHPLMHNDNEAERNELGYLERSSKKAGKVALKKLGALSVRDLKTGVEFDIGTGFTDEQRVKFWNDKSILGKWVKYKYQPVGVKDKPRFPVFIGFRDPIDL